VAKNVGRSAVAIRITYFVSHPIQYQAPLLRRIAAEEGVDLRVVFEKRPADQGFFDTGFKRPVEWDVPLTEGYEHTFLADTDPISEIKGADVLWLHGWGSPIMRKVLTQACRPGVPVLMRGENCDLAMPDGKGPRGWLKRRYIAWVLKRCHAFLAIGMVNKNYYLRRGISPDRIFPMPYAIDNENFTAKAKEVASQRLNLKAEFDIAPEQKVVLFVGKFMPRKRPDFLVRAMNRVDWLGVKPALVFVGSGELEKELRVMAPDAVFLGFQNQSALPAFYDMADVMVVPSEREPWGLVVNEAMACGTAVIASDQVGCAVDLIDDACGRIFPSGDVSALADALVICLENSEQMGMAAETTIRQWGFEADIEGLKQAIDYVKSGDDTKS
jgi:glycosyltransferase involved in cell wall biosynthesis